MRNVSTDISWFCRNFGTAEELIEYGPRYPDPEDQYSIACILMACADDADTGPVQVGIVGGDVMEFGKQRGVTQIPF